MLQSELPGQLTPSDKPPRRKEGYSMKFLTVIAALAAFAAIAVGTSSAAGVTVSASPDPVAVGSDYTITVCGTGGRTVSLLITEPDGSQITGQFVTTGACGSFAPLLADQAGDYLIQILNKNGSHVLASTTETAV
jgi:hypothetical protein